MGVLKYKTLVWILLILIVIIVFMFNMNLPRKTNVVTMIKIGASEVKIKDESQISDPSNQHEDQELLKRKVERLKSQGKALLVTVVNDGFLPFANSWLCQTRTMNIHEQVLIIALNENVRYELTGKWPNIDVVVFAADNFHGNQKYTTAGYVRLLIKRVEVILELLKNEIAIFMFEMDSVWMSNPLPDIEKHVAGHDMAAAVVPQRDLFCPCFMYMKPTSKTISMWEKLTEMMRTLGKKIEKLDDKKTISESENDQVYISRLLNSKYGGILLAKLPLEEFPDGKWYSMKETERKKIRPLVIHNNWIVGNGAKIARAKKFHHWFWDAETGNCDTDLVKATINQ